MLKSIWGTQTEFSEFNKRWEGGDRERKKRQREFLCGDVRVDLGGIGGEVNLIKTYFIKFSNN